MTAEKLAQINQLNEKLNAVRGNLNSIRGKTIATKNQPAATVAEQPLPQQNKPHPQHTLYIEFDTPTQASLAIPVPAEVAKRFLADIERHYQGEYDALRAEFDRV